MVEVQKNAELKPDAASSHSSSTGPPPIASSPLPPPSTPSPPSADAILQQCLKLLKGNSDEHKFAGLVMVTKHVPALTNVDGGGESVRQQGRGQLREICDAVGTAFVHRLLKTTGDRGGDKADVDATGGSGGGGGGGLSVYQQIALGVLSAFLQDESLIPRFAPVAPALVRAIRAVSATTESQALFEALACIQAIAGAPGGMERLLRAGAAPAVVIRLVAASKAKILVAAADAARASGDTAARSTNGNGNNGDDGKHEKDNGAQMAAKAKGGESANVPDKGANSTLGAAAAAVAAAERRDKAENSSRSSKTAAAQELELTPRAEALAFAFLGRALEATAGECLGQRELIAIAEAFRDDPTPAKFAFMDLLLRWAALQEGDGLSALLPKEGASTGRERNGIPISDKEVGGVDRAELGIGGHVARALGPFTRRGAFPAALREGLVQALHGAAGDERRDSALALLASLLRTVGQEWAVERDADEISLEAGGAGSDKQHAKRKRGTFVAFAVRIAAGEVRILLDESLSLLLPKAASLSSVGDGSRGSRRGAEVEPGFQEKARGPMGPAGVDPSIGLAAEIAAGKAAAMTAAATEAAGGIEDRKRGESETGTACGVGAPLPPREPLSARELKVVKEQRAARLLRMLPVSLGVVESTVAFLCGGGAVGGEEEQEDDDGGDVEGDVSGRWEELPIDTLQDLQKTLVGLFGFVFDFMAELRPWIVPGARATTTAAAAAAPSPLDVWVLRRLGLDCSRALGMWMAEDPESLPQRFLEGLPVLLALNARREPPDSDDEDSDAEENDPSSTPLSPAAALRAFPGAASRLALLVASGGDEDVKGNDRENAVVDEALHNILRALLALSYEPTPLAAMVEEGVTARIARLIGGGGPAIAALLTLLADTADKRTSPLPTDFAEQTAEAIRAPLITACGLLTNILTSAGHLAWPETGDSSVGAGGTATVGRPPTHPVLAHPAMGECLASLAEIAGLAGAARRKPIRGGTRWRLLAAHATLVILTVARAATPGTGLEPARDLSERKARWDGAESSVAFGDKCGKSKKSASGVNGARMAGSSSTVWDAMARAVDEGLGSLSRAPGRGLIGGKGFSEDEEASYEEGAIWQWCLECARAIEAAPGGGMGNSYVANGVVPRRVLKSVAEASSDGRI